MKKLFFSVYFILSIFYGFSQSNITGKITNTEGEPLIGANVILENTFYGASTNSNGNFTFKKVNNGEYFILVSYIGYNDYRKKIVVSEDIFLNISIESSSFLSNEIIVKAIRVNKKSTSSVTNVSKKDIENNNTAQDIPYLLEMTPSMVSSSDAGAGIGYTNFRIRGTDMSRINVTVNGIPLNDPESHGVWWVNMPDFASVVDNIQIQRGVGTSTNGSAAFGASVDFQTNSLSNKAYAKIHSVAGSFNTYKNTVSLGTGLINKKFAFETQFSKINSDGYIDRAFSDLKSFYLSGAYYGKKSIFRINLISGKEKTYQAWWGVPEEIIDTNRTYNPYSYDNETDNYQQDHFQVFYSNQLNKSLFINLAFHYTKGQGYYEQYKEAKKFSDYGLEAIYVGNDSIIENLMGVEQGYFQDGYINRTDLIRRKYLNNDFYGLTYSLNYQKNLINATIGGSANTYAGYHFGRIIWAKFASNSNINYEWYNNLGEKTDFNIFGKINYQIGEKINLYGDLQYRMIDYEISGIDDDLKDISQTHSFGFFNPKVGLFYEINNRQNLFLSFSVANREPNRSNYIDLEYGETEPKPEKLHDWELGYKLFAKDFSFGTNMFLMDYTDQLVLTGQLNDVGDAVMENVEKSYRAGIEIMTVWKPTKKIRWDMNATFSQNRIINYTDKVVDWDFWPPEYITTEFEKTNIAFSPEIIAANKMSYSVFQDFNISLISKYVGKQFVDNTANENRKLDAYFLNNVKIEYILHSKMIENIEFYLLVNNILNVEYESFASVYRQYWTDWETGSRQYSNNLTYFPQAGTNFLFGLKLSF